MAASRLGNKLRNLLFILGLFGMSASCAHQIEDEPQVEHVPEPQEEGFVITDWSQYDNYRLGHFLASLMVPENQTILEKDFEQDQQYPPWDCRFAMKSFVSDSQAHGYEVVWGLHESFILVRAFSSSTMSERLAIRHFALWHAKDPRFDKLPRRLIKGACEYYNQPFFAVIF